MRLAIPIGASPVGCASGPDRSFCQYPWGKTAKHLLLDAKSNCNSLGKSLNRSSMGNAILTRELFDQSHEGIYEWSCKEEGINGNKSQNRVAQAWKTAHGYDVRMIGICEKSIRNFAHCCHMPHQIYETELTFPRDILLQCSRTRHFLYR
jgi:hypothetical protein